LILLLMVFIRNSLKGSSHPLNISFPAIALISEVVRSGFSLVSRKPDFELTPHLFPLP
jgi:hypothetical protein